MSSCRFGSPRTFLVADWRVVFSKQVFYHFSFLISYFALYSLFLDFFGWLGIHMDRLLTSSWDLCLLPLVLFDSFFSQLFFSLSLPFSFICIFIPGVSSRSKCLHLSLTHQSSLRERTPKYICIICINEYKYICKLPMLMLKITLRWKKKISKIFVFN